MVVTDFEEIHDDKVMGVALSLENDGTRTTTANVSITLRRTWFTGRCYIKVSIAAHKNDRHYSILVLNTGFDLTKLFNGIISNPFTKSVLKSLLETMNFEPKFPLVPVRVIANLVALIILLLQGTYLITNFTADERLVPLLPNIRGFANIRVVGKVSGFKRNILIHHMKIYFEKR